MAVNKSCFIVGLCLYAAIFTVMARPQQKITSATADPYPMSVVCSHHRLLAGIEAAAKDLPDISAFIQAAKVSGLLDNVFALHRYTILAPTNAAFDNLATSLGLPSTQELLTEQHKDLLTEVVRLHFGVGGAHYIDKLQEGATGVHVFSPGETLQASTTDGQVTFQGPNNRVVVVQPDITLCNSVMHVVDAVLMPATGPGSRLEALQAVKAGSTAEL